jgi:hypothetical protein
MTRDGNIPAVNGCIAEIPEISGEIGISDSAGTHVDTSVTLAEIHRNTNNPDCFFHFFNP